MERQLATIQIFLSTVTAEFRSYRDALRHYLDRPNVAVKVQEDFIATGKETLDMLDLYIKHCHAVVHLVGDMTGAPAKSQSVDVIRERYPDFTTRFPVLTEFLRPDGPLLPYTQWEAWLALYHKKTLIICVPADGAARDERYLNEPAQRDEQHAHLKRLETIERHPGIRFANSDQLAAEVLRSSLQEILNAAGTAPATSGRMIDFEQELMRHGEIIGREEEIATVRGWIRDASKGWILIKGNPGTGKSAIMVAVLNQLENEYGPESVPYHFLRRRQGDWGEPDAVVSNLIARLETISDSPVRDASQGMDRLFALLKIVGQQYAANNRRLVVVVDGLDEAASSNGTEGLLSRFLPATVPENVFLICASRPNYPELGWLEERLGVFTIDLDQQPWLANNRVIVEAYWHKVGPQLKPPLDQQLIEKAIDAAEGNMLHAVTLCDAFKTNAQARDPRKIPVGFNKLIDDLWRRLVTMKDRDLSGRVLAGLSVLTVAYEALPLSALARLLDWRHPADIADFIQYARPFLLEESADWHGGEARYRPFHESIREFLTAADHMQPHVNREYHKLLAERLGSWPPADDASELERGYAARFALVHLSAIGDWARVNELLGDLTYCVAAVEAIRPQLLLARIAAFDTKDKPPQFSERVNALRRVLRRESQMLESYPRELPNLIHNHLTCLGQDRKQIGATFSGFNRGWGLLNAVDVGDENCILRGHTGHVTTCDLDSSGRYGVSGGWDGHLRIWDLARGTSLHMLRLSAEAVRCDIDSCAMSPDGRYVIVALSLITEPYRAFGRVQIWETYVGRLVVDIEHENPSSVHVAFAGNNTAVACHRSGLLVLYDPVRGSSKELPLGEETHGGIRVNRSATLIAAITKYGCGVWKLDGGKVCAIDLEDARACSFGPDDTTMAVGARTKAVIVDATDGSVLFRTEGIGDLSDCCLLDDKRLLIASGADCELVIWDLESDRALTRYEGHTYSANCCAVTPDGGFALSGGGDNTVRLWSLVPKINLVRIDRHRDLLYYCMLDAAAQLAYSIPQDDQPIVWNARSATPIRPVDTYVGYGAVRFCRFRGHVRLATLEGGIRLYDPETGRLEGMVEIPADVLNDSLVWLDDGPTDALDQLLIKAGANVVAWQPPDALTTIALSTGESLVTRLNRGRAIAALHDNVLDVTDLARSDVPTRIAEDVKAFVSSPCTNAVYALMLNGQLVRLDATSGKVLALLGTIKQSHVRLFIDAQETALWALCSNGLRSFGLVTDEALMAFSPETSSLLQETSIQGHDVFGTCFLSGLLITAGWSDATLRVWDAHQSIPLAVIAGSSPFRCVAAAGDRIVAGDQKGNVWFLAPLRELYP
jgi:WD40 repeat protein